MSSRMPKIKGAFFLDSFLYYGGLQCTVNWPKLFLLIMHIRISCRSSWLWLWLTGDISVSRRRIFFFQNHPTPDLIGYLWFWFFCCILLLRVENSSMLDLLGWPSLSELDELVFSPIHHSLKVCATFCWPCLTRICKTVIHLIQLNSSHATAVS